MKPSELDDFLHRNKMTGNELAAAITSAPRLLRS